MLEALVFLLSLLIMFLWSHLPPRLPPLVAAALMGMYFRKDLSKEFISILSRRKQGGVARDPETHITVVSTQSTALKERG